MFRKTKLSKVLLSGSTFLQSILKNREASAKTALPNSAPTTTKILRLFHKIAHIIECMADERLFAKMQRDMGCCIAAAVQE